jgi:hypothetical protein
MESCGVPERDRGRDGMLRELARKNLKLGAVQIGHLSAKQLRLDQAQWQATSDIVAGWLGEKPAAPKQTPDPMATFAHVA